MKLFYWRSGALRAIADGHVMILAANVQVFESQTRIDRFHRLGYINLVS